MPAISLSSRTAQNPLQAPRLMDMPALHLLRITMHYLNLCHIALLFSIGRLLCLLLDLSDDPHRLRGIHDLLRLPNHLSRHSVKANSSPHRFPSQKCFCSARVFDFFGASFLAYPTCRFLYPAHLRGERRRCLERSRTWNSRVCWRKKRGTFTRSSFSIRREPGISSRICGKD